MRTIPLGFKAVPSLKELVSAFPTLKALFFDMDGTLFNTESFHALALQSIAAEFNVRPPHPPEMVHGLMIGKADHLIFHMVKDWENFPKDWTVQDFVAAKNAHLLDILGKEDPEHWVGASVRGLLKEARDKGLYLALVTSSEKVITKKLLQLAGLENTFELVLTRDDCPKHKPDPWPYHKAQEMSGLDPGDILIFEDSKVGLEAALSSGAHVIKAEWY